MTAMEAESTMKPKDGSPFTIALAEVTNTIDATGTGRVQIQLPWLPTTQPWARVAVPGAGSGRGTYVLPHVGDEVLVAFNRSDVTDCYVIGSLWNITDPPPHQGPLDPTTVIGVRSDAGHDIKLNDIDQSITIETSIGHTIELTATGVKIATSGRYRIDRDGAGR